MKTLHFQPDHNLKLRKSQLIVLHFQLSPEVESLRLRSKDDIWSPCWDEKAQDSVQNLTITATLNGQCFRSELNVCRPCLMTQRISALILQEENGVGHLSRQPSTGPDQFGNFNWPLTMDWHSLPSQHIQQDEGVKTFLIHTRNNFIPFPWRWKYKDIYMHLTLTNTITLKVQSLEVSSLYSMWSSRPRTV